MAKCLLVILVRFRAYKYMGRVALPNFSLSQQQQQRSSSSTNTNNNSRSNMGRGGVKRKRSLGVRGAGGRFVSGKQSLFSRVEL